MTRPHTDLPGARERLRTAARVLDPAGFTISPLNRPGEGDVINVLMHLSFEQDELRQRRTLYTGTADAWMIPHLDLAITAFERTRTLISAGYVGSDLIAMIDSPIIDGSKTGGDTFAAFRALLMPPAESGVLSRFFPAGPQPADPIAWRPAISGLPTPSIILTHYGIDPDTDATP